MRHRRDIGARLSIRHRDARKSFAIRHIEVSGHEGPAQHARGSVRPAHAHASAEVGVQDYESIHALRVQPRQPGPHFDVDDDFPGPGAGIAEIGKHDLFAGAAARESFPAGIFFCLHAMAGKGDEREIPRLRVLCQGVHRLDEARPRRIPIENEIGFDVIPGERRRYISGVRCRAVQLRFWTQSRVFVHPDDEGADRSPARRAQNFRARRRQPEPQHDRRRDDGTADRDQLAHQSPLMFGFSAPLVFASLARSPFEASGPPGLRRLAETSAALSSCTTRAPRTELAVPSE